MRFDETVRLSVQEVLFGFQGAMIRFCRLLPGRVPVYLCTCVPVYLAYDNCLRTSKKPGKVLETQAGFSIVTPGTRRPMSENAIAMRWSL